MCTFFSKKLQQWTHHLPLSFQKNSSNGHTTYYFLFKKTPAMDTQLTTFFSRKLQQWTHNLPPNIFLQVAVVWWNVGGNKVVKKLFHIFTNLRKKGNKSDLKVILNKSVQFMQLLNVYIQPLLLPLNTSPNRVTSAFQHEKKKRAFLTQ